MNSRIILSQADFSANNIGRYVELSDLTKKVLAKQTQYGEDSTEALALNTFLNALTTEGFIGGENPLLKTLILPALASQHSEIFYNIANLDGNGYPTDEMSQAEAEAVTNEFGLVEDSSSHKIGIRRLGTFNPSTDAEKLRVSIDSHLFPTTGVTYPAFSMISYGVGGLDNYTNSMFTNRAPNYSVVFSTSRASLYYETNAYVRNDISNANAGKGFYGVSYVPETKFEGFADGGTIGATETTGTLSVLKTQQNSNMFTIGGYVLDINRNFKFAGIAFGDGLTMTQMTALKGYFDTLMTALHVNI